MALANMASLVMLVSLPLHVVEAVRDESQVDAEAITGSQMRSECDVCLDDLTAKPNKSEKYLVTDCHLLWPDDDGTESLYLKNYPCHGEKSFGIGPCYGKATKDCCAKTCCELGENRGGTTRETCVKKQDNVAHASQPQRPSQGMSAETHTSERKTYLFCLNSTEQVVQCERHQKMTVQSAMYNRNQQLRTERCGAELGSKWSSCEVNAKEKVQEICEDTQICHLIPSDHANCPDDKAFYQMRLVIVCSAGEPRPQPPRDNCPPEQDGPCIGDMKPTTTPGPSAGKLDPSLGKAIVSSDDPGKEVRVKDTASLKATTDFSTAAKVCEVVQKGLTEKKGEKGFDEARRCGTAPIFEKDNEADLVRINDEGTVIKVLGIKLEDGGITDSTSFKVDVDLYFGRYKNGCSWDDGASTCKYAPS